MRSIAYAFACLCAVALAVSWSACDHGIVEPRPIVDGGPGSIGGPGLDGGGGGGHPDVQHFDGLHLDSPIVVGVDGGI